ncbi:MAG: PH domain-containing protein [Clostridia bacterium]|nr:PH domain-containing protein [Clostridia bacterium]
MKKKTAPKSAIYFKYQFTKTMIGLAIAVVILCGIGIVVSALRIQKQGIRGFSDALKSPFLIAVCVFCIVTVLSIFVKSQYIVDERYFRTQFGFIRSSILIKDITSIVLNTDLKKLTVYLGEQYYVLSISPKWNETLVQALRKVNPDIDYSFTLAENCETPPKNNKSK